MSDGELTDKVRDKVRAQACRLGADALSFNGAVDFGSRLVGPMTQFLVLRKKEAPAAATAAVPTSGI